MRRDWLVARSYRLAVGLQAVSTALGIALYYFISETFDGGTGADLGAADTYFEFALVGGILAVVVQGAAVALSRRLREEQLTGTLEALLSQPIGNAELAVGMACYPFLWAAVRAIAYTLAAGVLLDAGFERADWLGALLVLVGTTAVLGALGILVGAVVLLVKRAEVLTGLLIFVLAFLGGAYFPVSVLPGWLEAISTVLPTRLAFDGLREALYDGSGWATEAGVLAAIGAVALPCSVLLFRWALAVGRARGTLTEY